MRFYRNAILQMTPGELLNLLKHSDLAPLDSVWRGPGGNYLVLSPEDEKGWQSSPGGYIRICSYRELKDQYGEVLKEGTELFTLWEDHGQQKTEEYK